LLGFVVNFKMDVSVKDCYVLAVSVGTGGWIRALLLVPAEFPALGELSSFIEATHNMLDQPLLLPIIVSEVVTNFAGQNIQICDYELDEL
jgi:hypothetical protein